EQVDGRAPHHHGPGADVDGAAGSGDRCVPLIAVVGGCEHQRGELRLDLVVAVLLPTVGTNVLVEVALLVEQSHSHERQGQVAGRLDVITGQHAQATRVDRHRVVQPELGT